MSDWNQAIIEEFRANDGSVKAFGGKNLVLLHHVGRSSGREFVSPVAFFPVPNDPASIWVVASAAGAPKHPQWYHNVVGAGRVTVEASSGTYDATVEELTGTARDEAWDKIVRKAPGFGDYATKTAGVRIIPVLALHRA